MSDWTEQSLDLWQTYTDAQRELWNGWFETAGRFGVGATVGAEKADGDGGEAPPWGVDPNEWLDRWQDMARKTLKLWTAGTDRVPAEVIDRLFSGEEAFVQFLDLSLGALKIVAPKIDAGEDWADILRRYLAQVRDGMLQGSPWLTTEGVGSAAAASPELWTLYATELQRFMGPWAEAIQVSLLDSTGLATGDREAVTRAQTAFMDAFDGTFGRYASAPSVGASRELNERVWRGFEAWVALRRASTDFQNEMTNTGFHTYEKMLLELVEKGERGEKVTTLRSLFDLWIDMGEAAYGELFATDGFAELQGTLVNASMQYQLRSRELQEELLTAMGQPTRTEIDKVHRHVYDLRVEVRFMKRSMAAARRQIDALSASLLEAQQAAAAAAELAEARQAEAQQTAAAAAELAEARQAEAQQTASVAAALAETRHAEAQKAAVVAAEPIAAMPEATPVRTTEPGSPSAAPTLSDAKPPATQARARSKATKTAAPKATKTAAPKATTAKAAGKTAASKTTTAKTTKAKAASKRVSKAKPAAQEPEPGVPGEGK